MRQIFGYAAMLVFAVLAWGAQSTAPAKKAPGKSSAVHKTPARRTTAATHTAASKSGKKGGVPAKRPVAAWRTRQLAPTADRYRQIQEALASKGYLRSEDATGTWNPTSVDALKRFQAEQNIEATGKINSLSLIALGLGPKHEAVVKPPAPSSPAQDPLPGRE
jgi:peptidoglycan hydrolase-like protein with peptidoglycan-binding domain